MGTIRRRALFVDDVYDVWSYIARDNENHADSFVLELERRYEILSDNPLIGVCRFPHFPTMRICPFRNYVIIYDPLPDGSGVELIRLLNAARDYRRYFED